MNIVIVEDEQPAAKRLAKLVRAQRAIVNVMANIESVKEAVSYFSSEALPDLVFMDIQLADGLSFDIFRKVDLQVPVIFTTAYDQYMLNAFKVNSIDYLLKPIDEEELEQALNKFDRLKREQVNTVLSKPIIDQLFGHLQQPNYKKRFLIKSGQQISYLPTEKIRYFFSDEGIVQAKSIEGRKFIIDFTLDQLEQLLDPDNFFRVNRKFIIHVESIKKVYPFFNSRLKINVIPSTDMEIIVSRDRVSNFKRWLDT